MSYFTNDCGLATVMFESDLIGGGSVNAFLAGKHFNQCKRLHVLVALALQMQQFDFVLQTKAIILTENVKQFFTNTTEIPLTIENEDVLNIMNEYSKFEEEVLQGTYIYIQGAFQNKRDFFKIAIYSGAIF